MIRAVFFSMRGPLSVGGGALDGWLPRSDGFSAALLRAWAQVAGAGSGGFEALAANPPFIVSSALPWVASAEGGKLLFYPLPPGGIEGHAQLPEGADAKLAKRVRRVRYATRGVLSRLSAGVRLHDLAWLQGGALAATKREVGALAQDDDPALVRRAQRTRLAVDRATGGPIEGLLYDVEAWYPLREDAGIAVLVELAGGGDGPLRAAAEWLAVDGIGRDRTVGYGALQVEAVEPWNPPPLGLGKRLLLSVCHPTADDLAAGALDGRYEVLLRSGWVTSPTGNGLRRRSVRMLAEGAVVPDTVGKRPGDVVDVTPAGAPHPVFRDGRGLTLDIDGRLWA